jgi:hypothetical protein
MLEPCVNQAAGLQSLLAPVVPRLVAVASHGQQQAELPLLWALCNSWVDMGLSVLVLDGHAQESANNTGLMQLFDNPLERCQGANESIAWSVLPAAQGFARLCAQALPAAALGELFQNYSVVLVYASASTMTGLFKKQWPGAFAGAATAQVVVIDGIPGVKTVAAGGPLAPNCC